MTFNFTTQMALHRLSPMPMNKKLECKDQQIYSKTLKKIWKKEVYSKFNQINKRFTVFINLF